MCRAYRISPTPAGAAPSSGYCMDLGNGNTIATASIYSDNRNDLSCSGDFTLAVKNEVPCNKITNSAECGSNKTCTWDSTSNTCSNDHWNKWFCSKPKDKCAGKWSSVPGFFGVDA